MTGRPFVPRHRSLLFALVALVLSGCGVSLDNPAGRACDATHGCAGGQVCLAGVCDTNIYPNGTFESGCGTWMPFDATAMRSSVAHSGQGSCEFCSTLDTGSLDDKGFLANPTLGLYAAQAWVRVAPNAAASSYGILLRTAKVPEGGALQEVEKAATNLEDVGGWQQASVELQVTMPADVLNVVVYAQMPTCLLVDDVTAERIQ